MTKDEFMNQWKVIITIQEGHLHHWMRFLSPEKSIYDESR